MGISSPECRHPSLKFSRTWPPPFFQHPPPGCRRMQTALEIWTSVFSLQLCCNCKLPSLPGPQFPSLLNQMTSKAPSSSILQAGLFTPTPSPVQRTRASSCPTPALGKQEAG